jgi:hypothetical protein
MIDTVSKKKGQHVAEDEPVAARPGAAGTRSRDNAAAGPAAPVAPRTSKEPRIERIARRAHEIYVARGGEHGKALDDWLQAEREIDAEDDQADT